MVQYIQNERGERKIETTRQHYERLIHTLRRIKHNCFYTADYWKKQHKDVSKQFLELATEIVVFLDKVENIKFYPVLITTSRIKQLHQQCKTVLDVLRQPNSLDVLMPTNSIYCCNKVEFLLLQAELLILIKQQRSTLNGHKS